MTTTELSAEQKRSLFEAYEKTRQKVASAAASHDVAVKNIAEQIGTGPFRWQGEEISIVKRGERFTVRTKAQAVEEIV